MKKTKKQINELLTNSFKYQIVIKLHHDILLSNPEVSIFDNFKDYYEYYNTIKISDLLKDKTYYYRYDKKVNIINPKDTNILGTFFLMDCFDWGTFFVRLKTSELFIYNHYQDVFIFDNHIIRDDDCEEMCYMSSFNLYSPFELDFKN